ncbi:MAG: hypothetical protein KGZ30_04640 [Anaplasmataceae bacterium]|nr:hypothetical protein [Anaplasmataceae bacterium]
MVGKLLRQLWQPVSSVKKIGHYFRIIPTHQKLTSLRPLAYVFFAYALTFPELSLISLINILVITLIVGTSYFLNDYYDHLLRKEDNFSQKMLRDGHSVTTFLYFWLVVSILSSLVFSLGLIKNHPQSVLLITLLSTGLLLAFTYSWPPLRLKDRLVGPMVFPLAATILFLEAWALHQEINTTALVFSFIILIFQSYLEILHQIEDAQQMNERVRIKQDTARTAGIIMLTVGGLLTVSLGIIRGEWMFLLGTIFWWIRLIVFTKTPDITIPLLRSRIWSPLLSVYEFLIYAIFGFISKI